MCHFCEVFINGVYLVLAHAESYQWKARWHQDKVVGSPIMAGSVLPISVLVYVFHLMDKLVGLRLEVGSWAKYTHMCFYITGINIYD